MRSLSLTVVLLVSMVGPAWSAHEAPKQIVADQHSIDDRPLVIQIIDSPKPETNAAANQKPVEPTRVLGKPVDVWGLIITGILALVGLATAAVLIWQFKEMRKATVAARDAASAAKKSADASILSLRPWLSCDVEVLADLTFNADGHGQLPLKFTVRNVGKTPALSVELFFPQISLSGGTNELSILKLQRLAAANRGLPAKVGAVARQSGQALTDLPGRVLFPDCEWIERLGLLIQREEIEKAWTNSSIKDFWPELIVLVTYSYHLAEIRADTGRIYSISRVTKDGTKPFVLGESVPSGEIRLEPHPLWSAFAT